MDTIKRTAEELWREFSDTGRIGAYLMYKAVKSVDTPGKTRGTPV